MGMAKEHFVLVHGEGHGGWCWFKLRWLLEGSGYRVTCIDLAGGGVDPTDPNTVRSFEQYDKPLLDLVSTLPEGEKVFSCPDLETTNVENGVELWAIWFTLQNSFRSNFRLF
jgi:hypothetical protein